MKRGFSIAAMWFVMWMLTWPALLAGIQATYPTIAQERFRSDLGFSMGAALLPPVWVITPFMTGFYEHGFQFGRLPDNDWWQP